MSQAVEDLLWVVNSPSFVSGSHVAPKGRLDRPFIDKERLHAFLEGRASHRVGHYFEALLHFWLEHIRGLTMVGAGIQLRDGKRTVGEIDFLYEDERGLLTHCEASVKFFLHHPRPDTSDYPGPNATDNYERKISKLFDQQLVASAAHYPDVVQRHAFVKGIVFYRTERPDAAASPVRLPADHLRGRWLRACELDELRSAADVVGCVADKPHWLAPPVDVAMREPGPLCDAIDAHFEGPAYPLMVSMRGATSLAETERLFVVSDDWPDTR